jgi:hypothetical protein
MKRFLLFFLLFFVFSVSAANRIYLIKDKTGNLLLETTDTVLVKQFSNVIVDSVDQTPRVIVINDTASVESINTIIEHKILKTEKAIFYYSKEWKTPNNGYMTLNKNAKLKSTLIVDGLALLWLKSTIPALFDSIEIKPKRTIAELDSEIISIEKKKK